MSYDPILHAATEGMPPRPPLPDEGAPADRERANDLPSSSSPSRLLVRTAAEVTPTTVRWLWDQRIAHGKLNVLGGPPGVGKSYLTCTLAAAVSRGRRLPGDNRPQAAPGRTLILSYEDDPEDTLRPRLDLLDADLDLVDIIEGVEVDGRRHGLGPEDVAMLAAHATARQDVRLVVVDPVSAFVGSGTDEHRGNEVRAALENLRLLAQEHGFAVVLVMHTRKSTADTALNRLAGSQAYGALVRSALMAGPIPDDEDGRHALAHVKHNLAAKQSTLAYKVTGDGLVWCGEVDLDAEEVAGNDDTEGRSAGDEARAFLRELLADGPVAARTVQDEATDAGIATRTLKRAKKALGITSERSDGAWSWVMPSGPTVPTGPDTVPGTLGPLGTQPSPPVTCADCDEAATATDRDGTERCAAHVSWNRAVA